ncbi:MAG TPA: hypothetical protein VFD69_18350 [Vicinamibacterales bacterium]|nr:hypothetical protein [Vicinamibacterales bacterium]
MTLDSALHAIEPILRTTALGAWMRQSQWAWPVLESLHFIGMSVLIGTIGLFDLRLLGFARGVPYAALHRLIPVGIAAYTLNLLTGICFLSGAPDQYLFNPAFRFKVTFMAVAGLNVLFFYTRVFRRLQQLPADSPPPLGARLAGAVSLTMWVGVMSAGRLLTFFRPPYV